MNRVTALGLALALCSGCSSYAVAKYGVSVDTVITLKTLGGQQVSVGPFGATKGGQTSIMCRGVGPVKTPDDKPFEEYVRNAFVDELRVAGLLGDAAPMTLTGNLDRAEFNSMSGKWMLDLTVNSSNGRSVKVSEVYDYETSFVGEKACALSAQAFSPAVQELIGKTVRNPEFSALLR